ncbi:DUF72 domain-containing protein [Halalkalibacillus sediminis]|uniref:DUF72 domain-containing protein n=1 Tax=Halalkalibacillus sediminis TaxID=2018042 RepID=A0A2I0QWW9_9BACI|nr:DUF72 domain-containing protein [Halalkalibacillus sediminis]PKR78805.1 DUF72 domain-containing protein [Halalkalibacillus sediminis]
MIRIGLTGWGDHPAIHSLEKSTRNKLATYASHFPTVEVDSAFYSIISPHQYSKWIEQTPSTFTFVVKAFQAFTGHDRKTYTRKEIKEMIKNYKDGIQPLIDKNQLQCLLFQFPPWFDASKAHVQKLKFLRQQFEGYPLALEFRNRSWFEGNLEHETLRFMYDYQWIHSICDEPQAGKGSVPIINTTTHPDQAIIRFHGRNVHGWNNNGQSNWRSVRFLYNYSENELKEWCTRIHHLEKEVNDITILFNNNSGGDAYHNAKQLIDLLDIEYDQLNPKQIGLFD